MKNPAFERTESFIIVEIIEYVPGSAVTKTVIRKAGNKVTAFSFYSGEAVIGKLSEHNTFIQVIEGRVEVVINGQSSLLSVGQSITIPPNARNSIKADVKFKLLSAIVKNGQD